MQILSYLFKKPQTGDKGSVFWPALEEDIQKMNDHTHNGTNTPRLTSASMTSVVQNISSVSWSATSGGTYRQLVTLPGTMLFDEYGMIFKGNDSVRGTYHLTVERVSSNTYYVYINDNTVSLRVYYVA